MSTRLRIISLLHLVFSSENALKLLFSAVMEKLAAFEANVTELEANVTSAEDTTAELTDLLEQLSDNLTQAMELVMSSEIKLRVEIWRQLNTAITLNDQLRRRVSKTLHS
jgi:Na+/phosphate symporter